jgi:hypothetical protein
VRGAVRPHDAAAFWFSVMVRTLPLAFVAAACGTSPTTAPPPPPIRVAPAASATGSGLPAELKGPEYTENEFVESDHNRDPFRSFLVQNQPVNKQACSFVRTRRNPRFRRRRASFRCTPRPTRRRRGWRRGRRVSRQLVGDHLQGAA